MNPEQLFVYTEETYIHAQLAILNYSNFQQIVADVRSRQRREVWMYLQSFLSHFGMVSKLLYAPSANAINARARARERTRARISIERAQKLREYLETDESSALNDRNARNAIEHLDERMDSWLTQEDKGFLECVFSNRADYDFLKRQKVVRRVYLVDEVTFITQQGSTQKEMPLQPIVDELHRIIDVCSNKMNNENPYHIIQPNL